MNRIGILGLAILAILAAVGCGGTRHDRETVYGKALDPGGIDPAGLPPNSALNVRLFRTIPDQPFFVLEENHTTFAYLKDSVTYRKIEFEEHVKLLRARAAKLGANGLIVFVSDRKTDQGGVINPTWNEDFGGAPEVLHTSSQTQESVTSFAIYLTEGP